jgi:hypothetical protein
MSSNPGRSVNRDACGWRDPDARAITADPRIGHSRTDVQKSRTMI